MSSDNGTRAHRPYVPCAGCDGMGIIIGPVQEATWKRGIAEHAPCAGSGILILRGLRKGLPVYSTPRLGWA